MGLYSCLLSGSSLSVEGVAGSLGLNVNGPKLALRLELNHQSPSEQLVFSTSACCVLVGALALLCVDHKTTDTHKKGLRWILDGSKMDPRWI